MEKPAILALEDGTIFHGNAVGLEGITCGEIVFNTAMTGYQEILTDPSYAHQMITFTYPHIGNVGVNASDEESSRIWATGVIMRELSPIASSWRAEFTLGEYLKKQNIVGISNIDTRHLTHKLRQQGSLNGCIMSGEYDEQKALSLARNFEGLNGKDLTSFVSSKVLYQYHPPNTLQTLRPSLYRIVVIDFGVKRSILRCLASLGFDIIVMPATTSIQEIIKLKPEGIILSNGPGDPKACHVIISNIISLLNFEIPILGICLGHQLLSLALGANTVKMDFGHHGANHPVQDIRTRKVIITNQNHNFIVDEETLPPILEPAYRSLFDGSLQGIKHKYKPFYSFQGHPEAGPGPHDALILFNPFVESIKTARHLLK